MPTQPLPEKYADRLSGVLNCYDRIVLTGSLQPLCYAQGMTKYLYAHNIRIFDFAQFAEPLTAEIRRNAEAIAQTAGLTIEFIRKKNFRKEDRIHGLLKKRGDQPGLVHIFSAMEPCTTYKPWHDKPTGKTFLKPAPGKCLHYYFYFIDAELGLCYLRVPTWCPFRLQFYCNGHAYLAAQLRQEQITFTLQDNAFTEIGDFAVANQLAAAWNVEQLHARLDSWAQTYCPVVKTLNLAYHWSVWQIEYATDLVFKHREDLQAVYPHLVGTLIQAVKPQDIATFLGRKLHGNYQGELGSRLNRVRQLGTRIKYHMGPVSLKMYDKHGVILRIEVTANDVSFFPQYRQVQHRDGTTETKWTKMRKSIYSLPPLRKTLLAANERYLDFLSELETPEVGLRRLNQVTQSAVEKQRHYKGFNLLAEEDASLLRLLVRGEFAISGITSRVLRALCPDKTAGQITRLLKRLRVHGLVKKVGKHYKYYLTDLGRQITTMALRLREMYVIPTLAQSPAH